MGRSWAATAWVGALTAAPAVVDVPDASGVERVRTADGFEIALHRRARPGAPAVVLCHGISSNHHFWDFASGRSLSEYLHGRGFDVWNLDLRGHGDAERDAEGRRQPAGWTVDDYARFDLPAAFAHVRAATGQATLGFVGHSLGGMVLSIYLADHAKEASPTGLSAAVVVGSPLDFRDRDRATDLMLVAAPWASGPAFLPTPLGGRLLGWVGEHAPLHADEMLFNPLNVAVPARAAMLSRIVSPLSRGEIRQLAVSRGDGEFRSADGRVAYREQLRAAKLPMLFLAGRADRVAHPDQVRAFHDAVGSEDKAFVVYSRANGFSGDYGHLDFGVGDRAVDEVFPRIERWLTEHP